MSSIFVPKGNQFHAYECVKRHEAKRLRLFRLRDVGRDRWILRPQFFSRENNMHGITRTGVRTIQENIETLDVAVNKPRSRKRSGCRWKINTTQKDIHVLCVANCSLIHARNPRGHGVSTGDCIRNTSLVQGRSRPQQSVAYFLHGSNHPLPRNITILGRKHCTSFLLHFMRRNKLGFSRRVRSGGPLACRRAVASSPAERAHASTRRSKLP